MPHSPDYYALLGVFRNATQEDIKRAYLDAAQRLHPDKNKAPGETEFFLGVQQAYETLSNPKRRKAYDETLPEEDDSANPIELDVLYSRPALVRGNETQALYALVSLRARRRREALPVPPLNVCLVLDRSTSMKDAKMDLLKTAAIQLLRDLRDEDIISVVAFGDKAEVVIPAAYHAERMKLEARIRDIQPGGATEILRGLESGLNEVRRAMDARRVNHLILLTDGHTYGDEQACLQAAAKAAEDGIGISAMGIGADWNDAFLDELAGLTGNNSRYIARPQDIQKLLAEKFSELTRVVADEVRLQHKLADGVRLNYAFRLQPESGPLNLDAATRLGPILRDAELSILFEFLIQPEGLKGDYLRLLEGGLKISLAAHPKPPPPLRLAIEREIADKASTEPPPPSIVKALSSLTLYRMQERARSESQAGNYERATRSLKNLVVHLLEQGHRDLADTVLLEAENMQRKQTFSLSGEKDIKYATRALISEGGFQQ